MASKNKSTAEERCDHKKHDPQRCFRCRLYDLIELEFHPETDAHAKALLFCMSEVAGMLLSQMEPHDIMRFVKYTFEWRDISAQNIAKELGVGETKH